jgi:lysophospholipase L1-like esterase
MPVIRTVLLICLLLSISALMLSAATTPNDFPVNSGLIARYDFTEGAGTSLTDRSGNGNHGTLASAPSTPVWAGGGLKFDWNKQQYVALPQALDSARTVMIVASYWAPENPNLNVNPGLVVSTAGTAGLNLAMANAATMRNIAWPAIYRKGAVTSADAAVTGIHGVTWVISDVQDKIFIDNSEVPYLTQGATAMHAAGAWQLGGGTQLPGWFKGTIFYMAVWNRELNAAEIQQSYAAIEQNLIARNIHPAAIMPPAGNKLIALGDSLTVGYTTGTVNAPYTAKVALDVPRVVLNKAVTGLSAAELRAVGDAYYVPLLDNNSNVCVIWAGTNDINSHQRTPAQAFADFTSAANKCRNAGAGVVALTMISRVGQDANKNTYNNLLRGAFGDEICDIAADPHIGADGANANQAYFQADGTHLQATAYANEVAPIVSRCVNARFGVSLPGGVRYVATRAYSELPADLRVQADPSAGNVTVTLPSAVGYTNQVRTVTNVESAGTDSVTVAAQAGENIGGAATVLVPAGATLAFKAAVDSPQTGGAHWEMSIPSNPVPAVDTLSPTSVSTSVGNFTLVVNGSNFTPQSVVLWNGAAQPTTWVSDTQVQSSIAAVNTSAAGTAAVSVSTPTPGGGVSNEVTLVVTGVPALSVQPKSLSFGSVRVGTRSTKLTAMVSNTGTASSPLANVNVSGEFEQTNDCPAFLGIGAVCHVDLVFAPTAAGLRSGSVDVSGSADQLISPVTLSGVGLQPASTVSATSLDFGQEQVGSGAKTQNVTLTNTGNTTLAISNVQVSLPFDLTDGCGQTLEPSAVCSIAVTFRPTTAGKSTGTLSIADDSGISHTVTLTATATDFTVNGTTPDSTTASVSAGQTATYTLRLTGAAGFAGPVSLSCSGLPQNASCTASPSSVTIGADTTNVTVSVATQATVHAAVWFRHSFLLAFLIMGGMCVASGGVRKGGRGVIAVGLLTSVMFLNACGAGGTAATPAPTPAPQSPSVVAPGTYTFTVTATSGTISHQTQLSLVVR